MKYKFEITVLSPVFIGSGNQLNRTDYILDQVQQEVIVINQTAFIQRLIARGLLEDYTDYLKRNSQYGDLQYWLKEKGFKKYNAITDYKIKLKDTGEIKKNVIHTCIKDIYGHPYIPGSSIKGSLVSALIDFTLYGKNHQDLYPSFYDKKIPDNGLWKKAFQDKYEYLSTIQVSDSEPFEKDTLTLVRKFDISAKSGKETEKSLPLYRESIQAGTKIRFDITLTPRCPVSIDEIEQAIALRFRLIYGDKGVIGGRYKKTKEFLPDGIEDSQSIIILGAGAGFHTKTNLMAIYGDAASAYEATRKIMTLKFPDHYHKADKIISPNCIKVGMLKGNPTLLGICSLKRI